MPQDPGGLFERMRARADATRFAVRVVEEGRVLTAGDGIAFVSGLRTARLSELLEFGSGDRGIVFDLGRESIGVVLLDGSDGVRAGEAAWKTDAIASIPVGDGLLGRVVDPLGRPLDGRPHPEGTRPYPVEREAPPLLARDFITTPLPTGIRIVDALLPLGRGQRELIIGDPSTGKTALAVDALANQRSTDVVAVYAAIGHKQSQVLKVIGELRAHGDFSRTVVVAGGASDSLGLQYLAPYSATAVAEYFLDRGRDVLIVYDDLSKHAEAYRSLSLLLKRPPGREAYPGDIFFLHSRLLERSAKLAQGYGGGSLTALPIVETQQGRISSYIPTNLISITDGQLYLDAGLFAKGFRPAVDVGRSVSRIGGKAQSEAMKSVAERLKIDYSRFIEIEIFSRFGAHVEEETARLLRRGERMREILKQPRFAPSPPEEIVVTLLALESGALDAGGTGAARAAAAAVVARAREQLPELMERLRAGGRLGREDRARVLALAGQGAA